jgi:hypothetical protein
VTLVGVNTVFPLPAVPALLGECEDANSEGKHCGPGRQAEGPAAPRRSCGRRQKARATSGSQSPTGRPIGQRRAGGPASPLASSSCTASSSTPHSSRPEMPLQPAPHCPAQGCPAAEPVDDCLEEIYKHCPDSQTMCGGQQDAAGPLITS